MRDAAVNRSRCLLGLVPEKDALGAGPQSLREPAHFVRPHLKARDSYWYCRGNH